MKKFFMRLLRVQLAMTKWRNSVLGAVLLCFLTVSCFADRGDFLSIGLIKYGENSRFDPYPLLWRELAHQIEGATSVEAAPVFKTNITVTESAISNFGIVFLVGSANFPGFSSDERKALSQWANLGGGLLIIINAETGHSLSFDKKIREEIREIFPTKDLERIPTKEALFRSFYLVRSIGGVLQRSRSLEGLRFGERYGLIYSPNDLLGALIRDREGNYLFRCYPGGEDQRKESFKLVLNLFLYGLTGTYKSDVIHLPFIEEKLKRSP